MFIHGLWSIFFFNVLKKESVIHRIPMTEFLFSLGSDSLSLSFRWNVAAVPAIHVYDHNAGTR